MAGQPGHAVRFSGLFMPRQQRGKSQGSASGASQRQLRVGELVRHAISDLLSQGSVHDPALEGHIITVPEVRMSPDLKLATIYVMPLGGRPRRGDRGARPQQEVSARRSCPSR
jgi:ribosome-binding factor A